MGSRGLSVSLFDPVLEECAGVSCVQRMVSRSVLNSVLGNSNKHEYLDFRCLLSRTSLPCMVSFWQNWGLEKEFPHLETLFVLFCGAFGLLLLQFVCFVFCLYPEIKWLSALWGMIEFCPVHHECVWTLRLGSCQFVNQGMQMVETWLY